MTQETDPRGLYRKYWVQRVDQTDQPGGKHEGCRYFVLDLDHDAHAIPALEAYRQSCRETHPLLARDLAVLVAIHVGHRAIAEELAGDGQTS